MIEKKKITLQFDSKLNKFNFVKFSNDKLIRDKKKFNALKTKIFNFFGFGIVLPPKTKGINFRKELERKTKLLLQDPNIIRTLKESEKSFLKNLDSNNKINDPSLKKRKPRESLFSDSNKKFFKHSKEDFIEPEFFKNRSKGFFWNHFYKIIDKIFIEPLLEQQYDPSYKFNSFGIMSDHLVSVTGRKIKSTLVESQFLLNLLEYKPVLDDIVFFDVVEPLFFNISKHKKVKKEIERNLDAFVKISYKDFVLTGACTYEELWFSLGFYYPLVKEIISRKVFNLVKKKIKSHAI
jgi:hypothetical protein